MLNIISKSLMCPYATGPQKVVKNLIKGLDKIGYPYILNKDPKFGELLWIHDDLDALKYIQNKRTDKVIVGPNIILSEDLEINYDNLVALQPSVWAKDFCLKYRFKNSPVEAWPTGIDTDIFQPNPESTKEFVLIYFKQRFDYELSLVEAFLAEKGIDYKLIRYGSYLEQEYQDYLSKAKYVIWIGRQESQGIALQEAMAMGVPMVVWDVLCIGHWQSTSKSDRDFFTREESAYRGATVAEFFNNDCGYKAQNFDDLMEKILKMEKEYLQFNPRKYITENLSLEKQAQALLDIFNKYGIKDDLSTDIKYDAVKNWRNEKLWKYLYRIKKIIKK